MIFNFISNFISHEFDEFKSEYVTLNGVKFGTQLIYQWPIKGIARFDQKWALCKSILMFSKLPCHIGEFSISNYT